jgi:dGTPase
MERSKLKNLRASNEFIKRRNLEEFDTAPYRTEFDRDRDRILYSKAFRRLKGKTQVFLSAGADHLRTRLTHTLEVSQIARIVTYNLNLDGTLTEAIALGHDLGHTPFGHVGERTLNQIMNNCDTLGEFQHSMSDSDKGFKHNWQGLRVVCDLEKIYGKTGLNLSNFTLWGILNHSSVSWKKCGNFIENEEKSCFLHRNPRHCNQKNKGIYETSFYSGYQPYLKLNNDGHLAWSFEGFIVGLADEIAQRHHDMEDAINMGIIDYKELIEVLEDHFKDFISGNSKNDIVNKRLQKKLKDAKSNLEFMPFLSKFIINFYTNLLIDTAKENLERFIQQNGLYKRQDFISQYSSISEQDVTNIIAFPSSFQEKDKSIQTFLKNRILNSYKAQQMDGKGRFVIRRLFKAYITNPRQLFDSTVVCVFRNYESSTINGDEYNKQLIGKLRDKIDSASYKSNPLFQIALLRAICDNISGMTDDFALSQHKQLYG